MIKIAPSLLASDYSNLQKELDKISSADYLHLDIMDGTYVPNLTFGPGLIKAIRPYSNLVFDTHLMINNPSQYIKEFAQAGSDLITFHAEAAIHIHRVIQKIKLNSCKAGIALNPATSLKEIEYVLPDLDLVLIMSVNPGFGGQKFIPEIYNKIKQLSNIIDKNNYDIEIAVDGGIKLENLKKVIKSGTDVIIAGSAIFNAADPSQKIQEFRANAERIRKNE